MAAVGSVNRGGSGGGSVRRLGKYELLKKLGEGNFSKVRLAVDSSTGNQCAIKIIDKDLLVREHMEEQLKREITLMRRLQHPNIVRLLDVMQTDNHIYLVMELVTGGELFEKIAAETKFKEDVARRYFQQLMSGIHYCHEQGIAHRDIKPQNLLLDGSGVLKISDFGLSNVQRVNAVPLTKAQPVTKTSSVASAAGESSNNSINTPARPAAAAVPAAPTLLQTVCGTPNYVAPEVLKEQGYDGLKADLWSCGVVLYVMLAGYLPFEGESLLHLFAKIERGEYRMSRGFSPAAKDLIAKLLTVDPNERITLDGILNHPWLKDP